MNIFREIPPTAGFNVTLGDVLSLFIPSSKRGELKEDFKNYIKADYAEITYSGTAALYFILEALKELSSRKTVVIPSFICPLVPLAIRRAGLKVEVCDITKRSFDFDIPELIRICRYNNDILAVIPVHLAGIPADLDRILNITLDNNIFVIEDCAQSLGADYHGKKTGSIADLAFFSLCRGKGLTIYEGGCLVSNKKEYVPLLKNKIKQLVKNDHLSEGLKILELMGYALFYRPELFWFVFSLPQVYWSLRGNPLKARSEDYGPDFGTYRVSDLRQRIACHAFSRIEDEIGRQREKAAYYIRELDELKDIRIISEPGETRSNYPYLVIVFDDPKKCDRARMNFSGSGLGVSWVYDRAVTGYDYLKDFLPAKACPNAGYISRNSITLSTNSFLKEKDMSLIVNIIKDL
ncbi:MAG: DegT/DnrJ/EryC1/StrS family aminotransferase [Candidatus Omnitrophota bacterium]|nr:DegT/DnrJ/EryC1/StrS family aminotransferase [Candidatus Omnitrophota bacterium]MBU1929661.1 DegT/DnrJ/EryC1/StrS family aminotransferase [Candidatus Omnitrophota bacterium]MBU2035383.1 DegT/DnrJ/EryC1/StrS family aminotransferase [Candidatus Omnitrophota bacterium]MBU2221200.1 DegT/DnrJ/EryC1/StrS family aminotransferase [Candidatus Omnitrophota bacterium]